MILAFDLRELPDGFYDDPFPAYHALRVINKLVDYDVAGLTAGSVKN